MCDECNKRFTTYEKVEAIPLIIIKKDDNREAYDRSKIETGVLRACHKRPVSMDSIDVLVGIFMTAKRTFHSNTPFCQRSKDLGASTNFIQI